MERDLFGHEPTTILLAPESCDSALLCAWDAYRHAWRLNRHRDGRPAAEQRQLATLLDQASIAVIRQPARTLEGARAKLALISGADGELFGRHFCGGERLPKLMPFADFTTALVVDGLEAVEAVAYATTSAEQPGPRMN